MSIVLINRLWDGSLSVQRGAFYGDVEHCVKDIRRRHPKAYADDDWAPVTPKMLDGADDQQLQVLGGKPEFKVVWAGPYLGSCAYLVRSKQG